MPFTLRVTTNGEAEEFSFENGEARLGRTADNDIVIKDPSSSRSHARVYEDDGRIYVEDLKSANGTKLNAKALKAPQELKSGDTITIGEVALEIVLPETNDTMMGEPSSTMDDAGAGDAAEEDPNATMLKPPSAPPRPSRPVSGPRKAAQRPKADEPEEESDEPAPGESTKNFDVPPPKALQRRTGGLPARPSRAMPADDGPLELSAADKARQRRALQQSTGGRAQLLWSDLSLPAKIVVGGIGGLAVVAMLGLGVMSVIPKKVSRRIENNTLVPNGEPLPESYGSGEEVDFEKPDQKSFSFQFDSPTAIVGVLHYQAKDCSKEEVTIELNGNSLATIPPDTTEVSTRQLELVLPATQLKISEPNELVFDNVMNPPGEEAWKIWNVWVEVIPIPTMSSEEASRRAKQDIERADKMYEMRMVGGMNLFRSWKAYRDAWLLLEATPDRSADLLQISRTRMREIRPELDRKCSAMLVDYQKEMAKREPNIEEARKVLQNIPNHFEKEHPCYGMARGILRSMDDLSTAADL